MHQMTKDESGVNKTNKNKNKYDQSTITIIITHEYQNTNNITHTIDNIYIQ